jgi:hypothetical protein
MTAINGSLVAADAKSMPKPSDQRKTIFDEKFVFTSGLPDGIHT